jgi:hypothetical protein
MACSLLATSRWRGVESVIVRIDVNVKVRITEKPKESELDGVRLDRLERGTVREVSASIGSWLITQGYADPEMRQGSTEENQDLAGFRHPRDTAHDYPRRRSTD